MRTLTMIVLLVISSLTFGYEPYPPFFPTEYYLGYTFSEEKDFNYESFLRFHYDPVLHTFIMLDGYKGDTERNTGMLGVIVPFEKVDIGMGIGNNYPEGSLFMTMFQYKSEHFTFRHIWKTGYGDPGSKTQASIKLMPFQISAQHINHYGTNVGVNLQWKVFNTGISYHLEQETVHLTIALCKLGTLF